MVSKKTYGWALSKLLALSALGVPIQGAQAADVPAQDGPAPDSPAAEPSASQSSPADAASPETLNTKTDGVQTDDEASGKRLKFNVALGHNVGAKTDVDPSTILDLTLTFRQSDKISWLATQRLTKLYYVEEDDEDELLLSDTLFRGSYKFYDNKDSGTAFSTAAELTAPISKFSREQDLKTVASVLLTATQKLGPVSLLLRPFYRFHANSYKTLKHDDSGQTAVRYRLGLRFDASVELPFSLTLASSNQWIERNYEDPPYGSHPPDHDYIFDNSLTYSYDSKTSFSIGYSQSDRAEQLGNTDVYLFDEEVTQYYVSASRDF